MCPNCFPSFGISSGYIAAFAVCIFFFGIAVVAMIAAQRSGYLSGLEVSKHTMLDD